MGLDICQFEMGPQRATLGISPGPKGHFSKAWLESSYSQEE